LEVAGNTKKPSIPFKFNLAWLKEEEFISLVKKHWIPIDQNDQDAVQFSNNLKSLKRATVEWAFGKRHRRMNMN
jgi:hypothetical protein